MVRVDITNRSYQPTKRVATHVEERAAKFEKYVHEINQARFTLIEEKHLRICEIHIHARGRDFHAKGDAEDMLVAVDKASQSMERQLRRYKTKITDHNVRFDQPGLTSAAALEADRMGRNNDGDGEDEEI